GWRSCPIQLAVSSTRTCWCALGRRGEFICWIGTTLATSTPAAIARSCSRLPTRWVLLSTRQLISTIAFIFLARGTPSKRFRYPAAPLAPLLFRKRRPDLVFLEPR